ncbi:unnamed protein product [Miscanthus lutarioriparius]|uniref:Uncharacterized protein n=1 Tax=Miscanthus lutarioriparius TaxID=422564 RepID=A0A811MHJ2_9POAL|nr:unnamed protein product [Miscanthus lutarioriparius]
MLTAAVSGDVFASPPIDSILAAIRAVTGPLGCLLIVKHGEPGIAVIELQLGATPIMELMIAARKAVPELQLVYGIAVDRVYTGTLMTSLDMAGLSITIMKSDDSILKRLDAPTKALAWPVGSEGNRPPAKFPVPLPPSPSIKDDEELSKQGCILEAAIEASATAIINLKDSLNEWDSKVGDGDCGTTMCRGATTILEDMKKQ